MVIDFYVREKRRRLVGSDGMHFEVLEIELDPVDPSKAGSLWLTADAQTYVNINLGDAIGLELLSLKEKPRI